MTTHTVTIETDFTHTNSVKESSKRIAHYVDNGYDITSVTKQENPNVFHVTLTK